MLDRAIFRNSKHSFLIGIGCEDEFCMNSDLNWGALDSFIRKHRDKTLFTIINYELGLDILNVPRKTNDLPLLRIWLPESTYLQQENQLTLLEGKESVIHLEAAKQLFEANEIAPENLQWKAKINRNTYIERVKKLKEHIQLGDVYEINFCQRFEVNEVKLESLQPVFHSL